MASSTLPETDAQRQERLMWELSTKSIFFNSGVNAVAPEYIEFLRQVANFLRSAPEVSVALVGNADERGGGQMASGLKRADAVKKMLMSFGVAESRIETISLGAKNPRATCHDESCWSQNRRVDFVYLGADSATK